MTFTILIISYLYKMNKLIYSVLLISFLGLSVSTHSQENLNNCERLCLVKKEVHDGAFLGLELTRACGEKGGIVVRVINDSPADKAGLKPGDHIVKVNAVSPDSFLEIVETVKACDPFVLNTISYYREGFYTTVNVKMSAINLRMEELTLCCDKEDELGLDFDLYPNPSVDNSFVKINHSQEDINNIQVFSLSGQLLYSYAINIAENNIHTLDISNMSNGVYTIRVGNQSGSLSKRLIVAN